MPREKIRDPVIERHVQYPLPFYESKALQGRQAFIAACAEYIPMRDRRSRKLRDGSADTQLRPSGLACLTLGPGSATGQEGRGTPAQPEHSDPQLPGVRFRDPDAAIRWMAPAQQAIAGLHWQARLTLTGRSDGNAINRWRQLTNCIVEPAETPRGGEVITLVPFLLRGRKRHSLFPAFLAAVMTSLAKVQDEERE